jgi:hypothetical protein
VVWFPAFTPTLSFTWLEKLRIPRLFDAVGGLAGAMEGTATLSFMEQWGGVILVLLLAGGVAGFIWCLRSLRAGEQVNESR